MLIYDLCSYLGFSDINIPNYVVLVLGDRLHETCLLLLIRQLADERNKIIYCV